LPLLDYGYQPYVQKAGSLWSRGKRREKRGKRKEIVMTESRVSGNVDGESLSVSRL